LSEFEEHAARYRAQALALMQMSEREIDAAQKSTWLEMVSIYKKLAEQSEEMQRHEDKRT